MTAHDLTPDGELTPEEIEAVNRLSPIEIESIDAGLLAAANQNYRKVAMVVGTAMQRLGERFPLVPDIFYSQRVQALVLQGKLVAQGNLRHMRYSEVKLP
jgi:hypothetical protein